MKRIVAYLFVLLFMPSVLNAQKVGLVMSGGGARGLAHIGVIKMLEENNIPIDYVAGTSMGAIVAALYSMGYTPDEMVGLMKTEDFQRWYTGTMDQKYMFYFKKNRDVPDLIKEQCASVCLFELTDMICMRIRERTLDVTEQLTLKKSFGQGSGIDADHGFHSSFRSAVDLASQHILTCSVLSRDKHGSVCHGYLLDSLVDRCHLRSLTP